MSRIVQKLQQYKYTGCKLPNPRCRFTPSKFRCWSEG